MLSRRQFLGRSAGLSFLTFGGSLPSLFVQAARAAAEADRNNHVLVVVELNGGNDGLNTVVPFENDRYYQLRPSLGIPKDQVHKLSDQVGLHPAMARAAELFKAGKLTIVQGVGYPEPNRSHFRSMEIWQTASTAARAPDTGWLGRTLDALATPADEGHLLGLALNDTVPQAFLSRKFTVPVLQQIDKATSAADESRPQQLLNRLTTTASAGDGVAVGFLRRQATATLRTAEVLRKSTGQFKSAVEYPGELGKQFQRAAQIITADLGVRLLYLSQGGYDHHSQQANLHPPLLTELSDGLAAFQEDLEKHRVADRVVVLAFSEFGRRTDENASKGTDHGAASCLFLAGAPLKGGLAGSYPSLEKLGDNDLIYTIDFRSVYATLLERWLGCAADKLLGAKFPFLDLLRA
jgi:uncharacterized protein (DUF1501 family)